ncbi:SCO6880 family protein [Phytohabitans aurantiacus]|nr:SCO6880 family protein [Phytohabitans aurantiacus]
MSTTDEPVRTYGGWRRSRGMGLMGLGSTQTLVVLAALTAVTLSLSLSLTAFAVMVGPAAVVIGGTVLRWDGVPLLHGVLQRVRWGWGSTRGYTSYRSGITVSHQQAWTLPGVLAPTRLLAVQDPAGDYGLVWHQRVGTMTATLRAAATSTWLVDREQAAAWVSNWGGWLSGLGHLPIVRWVTVTVDTAPASGSRLADYVSGRISPNAPASARRVLQQLVQVSPAAAADVETRVSITFDPTHSPTRPRNLDESVAEISRNLPGLQDALGGCGLTVLGRASTADLVAAVRAAFDPHARGDVARLVNGADTHTIGRYLDWDTAGPIAAEERYDHYQHDGGWSVSWSWHEAPRTQVHADVLARLLAPGPYPKRVSLLYRPFSAGEAARIVEREVNAASFRDALRAAQRRDENARDRADKDRALRAAHEEAAGAGVGLMSMFVTVTVTDEDDLGRAVADVESRAEVAKIRLRRMRASHASGFATTLPCGICPSQLATQWPR